MPDSQQQQRPPPEAKPRVHNPHWKGYSCLFLASLINLSATTNVPKSYSINNDDTTYRGEWGVAVSFGAVTMVFSALILVLDQTQEWLHQQFNYTTAWQGRLEGYVLTIFTIYWIIGVAYQTQVQGIAYAVMNVYFSAWLSLAAALYTLNLWSTRQDLLSWQEMTSVSATIKSWYILWLASLVVLGTCVNYYVLLLDNSSSSSSKNDDGLQQSTTTTTSHHYYIQEQTEKRSAATVGMVMGTLSSLVSMAFVMIHYRLIQPCVTGGWAELLAALAVTLCWVVGCAVLTQEGTIGATIGGSGSDSSWGELLSQEQQDQQASNFMVSLAESSELVDQCIVQIWTEETSFLNVTVSCQALLEYTRPAAEFVPGSNLYFSTWTCMAASVYLLLRWKAQQALQFAQAAQENKTRHDEQRQQDSNAAAGGGNGDSEDQENQNEQDSSAFFSDDDDSLGVFEDARAK